MHLPRRPGAARPVGVPTACLTGTGGGGSDLAGASCQLLTQRYSRQTDRKSRPQSGLIILLLEIKNSLQRVRLHSREDRSGHLGRKHANREPVFRPREGEPLSPVDTVPGPPVTAHGHLPVAPSGRAWPWEGALPQTQTCDGQDTDPKTGEDKTQRGRWVERSRLRAPAQSSLWAHRTGEEL